MEAKESKSTHEDPASWDTLAEVPFAGDLYRQKRFGHIAITNSLKKLAKPGAKQDGAEAGQDVTDAGQDVTDVIQDSNAQKYTASNTLTATPAPQTTQNPSQDTTTINLHEPDDETLCRQFLNIIHDNAETMELFINSDEIEFYENLAKTFRDRIDTLQFPYFAVDLFLLIKAWGEENYSEELIDDYYARRLMGIIRSYGYLS